MHHTKTFNRLLFSYSFLLLLIALPATAFGQDQLTCTEIKESKDIYLLGTAGGQLNSEIRGLEGSLEALQAQISRAIPEQKLNDYREQLDTLKNKPTRTPEEEEQLKALTLQTENAVTLESLNQKMNETNNKLNEKRRTSQCIQQRLSSIFSPEQSFKFWMSVAFAILIGLVIAGFFWLSNKDDVMRRAIFSGQAGMQFLTLFSIVIAIILFGITSILADKELSALLGGLSGYILGRSGTGRRDEQAEPSFLEKLASISVEPAALALTAASPTGQLTAIPRDRNGNAIQGDAGVFRPTWSSSNPAVATVDQSGLVTFVAPGTSNVTASFNNLTSNPCVVTCT